MRVIYNDIEKVIEHWGMKIYWGGSRIMGWDWYLREVESYPESHHVE